MATRGKMYDYNGKDSYKGLISGIIYRAILDYEEIYKKRLTTEKKNLINGALRFFRSPDFFYMCDVMDIDSKTILENLKITKDTKFISLKAAQKPLVYNKIKEMGINKARGEKP